MSDKNKLELNKNDIMTSIAKSTVGMIPFAGPALTELVDTIIPNQRIDRLTNFVQELDNKLSKIDIDKINRLTNDDEFIDLIEESFVQASRALTDKRRKYIASIISNGISIKKIKFEESKYLLKILQELNDIEIIWLRYFMEPSLGSDREFRQKHNNVLEVIRPHIGADEELLNKAALQKSYKEHLERLGLITNHYRVDHKTKLPEFDSFTGQQEISYTETSQLGKLLLQQIDYDVNN